MGTSSGAYELNHEFDKTCVQMFYFLNNKQKPNFEYV